MKISASATDFVGYTDFACDAKVLAIVNADGELVDMLGAGDSGTLVLDKTPFYAQSGGQVGDSGVIKNGADNAFIVADTVKNADKIFLHRGEVTRGIVSVGDRYRRISMRSAAAALCATTRLRTYYRLPCARYWAPMWSRPVSWWTSEKCALTLPTLMP